jgi:NodT family efflux transporter outer membrane factor (OMF) lipoprotein
MAFGDPQLNGLVEQALASNLDVASAWQRLREARAVARREGASRLPQLDGLAEASVQRSPAVDDEQLWLGVAAAYEVDLWGRLGSAVEAEQLRAAATFAEYRTAALTVSAEVTRTWFALAEARQQVELLDAQLDANQKILELLEARFGSGIVRGVDILRQRQLVEATREQRITAEAQVELLEHLLAVLLGRPPQDREAVASSAALPRLPEAPATGLPLDLVRRRPDVERAFLLVQAADRELAAAIANRYPRLTLDASLATEESDASDLFDDWLRSFAGSLLAPLFRGGALAAEVERSEAVRGRRVAEYGQATLTAFREVEDALTRERQQRERVSSLEEQVRLAEQSYEQLRLAYFNGMTGYIDVLTALTESQRLERELLAAQRTLLDARVALHRALAGGFETVRERNGEQA